MHPLRHVWLPRGPSKLAAVTDVGRLLDAARRQHGRVPPRRGLPDAEPGIIHVGHRLIRRVVTLPLCALADDLLDQLRLMRLHL